MSPLGKRQRIPAPGGFPSVPCIVGIVDSAPALRKSTALPRGTCDFLEWRADHLGAGIPKSRLPWIVTARHPAEGGAGNLAAAQRRELLLRLLPAAALVDVEIRSIASMRVVLEEARSLGVGLVASFHDFRKTPAASILRGKVREAAEAGAAVAKIATAVDSPSDIAKLLALLENAPLPLAVMGMGTHGKTSRLLFAGCGSVLNYGWISKPNVPGQWSAVGLRALFRECIHPNRN